MVEPITNGTAHCTSRRGRDDTCSCDGSASTDAKSANNCAVNHRFRLPWGLPWGLPWLDGQSGFMWGPPLVGASGIFGVGPSGEARQLLLAVAQRPIALRDGQPPRRVFLAVALPSWQPAVQADVAAKNGHSGAPPGRFPCSLRASGPRSRPQPTTDSPV